jgi:hypothetical protein
MLMLEWLMNLEQLVQFMTEGQCYNLYYFNRIKNGQYPFQFFHESSEFLHRILQHRPFEASFILSIFSNASMFTFVWHYFYCGQDLLF